MALLYIGTEGSTLSVDSSHYTLRHNGKKIGRIPPVMMDEVIIEDGIEISRKALDRLGNTGVSVTFMGREGEINARLVAPWRHDPTPRLEQARQYMNPQLRVALARKIVNAKIRNQISVLRSFQKNHANKRAGDIILTLSSILKSLESAADIDSVMGYEGAAARAYFSLLGSYLLPKWTAFTGRNRRPPLDPPNAALSYAYAILTNRVHALCESAGLDPYIAFLHGAEPRRPGLALDLMEPFRPMLADRFVWRQFNLKRLNADNFYSADLGVNGIRLTRDARAVFVKELVEWSNTTASDPDGEHAGYRPGGSILLKSIERFRACAAKGCLEDYTPPCMDDATTF